MINYVKPLWLYFFGILVSSASTIFSGGVQTAIQLVGGILSIIALVQLAPRNFHLAKAKTYTIAIVVVSLVILFGAFAFRTWLLALVAIGGAIAALVLAILSVYHEAHGLADMAKEAGDTGHAQKLRQFFTIYLIVSVASLFALVGPTLTTIVKIAGIALAAYQLYLVYTSIKIEEAYAAQAWQSGQQ